MPPKRDETLPSLIAQLKGLRGLHPQVVRSQVVKLLFDNSTDKFLEYIIDELEWEAGLVQDMPSIH
jgi:hypothetical protein